MVETPFKNPLYESLSLGAQTAYAEVFDRTREQELQRFIGLTGSFQVRVLRGREYVYFGYRDVDGNLRNAYIGHHDERTKNLIQNFSQNRASQALAPIVGSATALGVAPMAEKHFRILKQLSDYGFFKAGGLLIGTHAFVAMGNMLGVQWTGGYKTLDIDFAHAGKNISVALPSNFKMSVHDALTSLEMGLLPIREFSGKTGAQYRNPKDPELRIDFVTSFTRASAKNNTQVFMADLGLALEPLRFMEFSLEGTTQAVMIGRSSACVVNIPSPERYAIHKLIVYGERPVSERTKSIKDIEQAAAVLQWLLDTGQRYKIEQTWDDAWSRGRGWQRRLKEGWQALWQRHPELDFYQA